MMDIAIFLLNNTASYSKESSVDKLYVSIFAICNSETQFHSLLSRYFPDLSKKYFSTSVLYHSLSASLHMKIYPACNGSVIIVDYTST